MLLVAAVTLGKLWGAEPHVSPSTEYTGARPNELARYGSHFISYSALLSKLLIKRTTSGTVTTFNIYHHAPTTE